MTIGLSKIQFSFNRKRLFFFFYFSNRDIDLGPHTPSRCLYTYTHILCFYIIFLHFKFDHSRSKKTQVIYRKHSSMITMTRTVAQVLRKKLPTFVFRIQLKSFLCIKFEQHWSKPRLFF